MKIIKKIVAVVVAVALAVLTGAGFDVKQIKAADYSSASVLSFGDSWSGERYFTESESEHWYKIVIPSDGELNLRIMSYISYRVDCEIYNNDLSQKICNDSCYSGSETSPKTESNYYALSKGTYYCKISSYGTGKYKLYNTFESYNTNDKGADSFDSPYVYKLGSTIKGALTRTDEEDWYKITIPSKGYYSLKIVSYMHNYRMELYNADLSNKIDSWDPYGGTYASPKTTSGDFVLSKGIYYVKISAGYYGKYTFRFSKMTKNTCSHSFKSKYYDATYFSKGYTKYHCEKCGYTYKDDYVPVKKLSQGYLYSYCSAGIGKLNLSWSTVYAATGYQIRCSKDSSFRNGTVIKTVKGQSKNSKVISGLSRNRKYYVQVRAYKTSKSKTVYGKWSSKKCLKTK